MRWLAFFLCLRACAGDGATRVFAWDEVATHNTADDCLIVIFEEVYNFSDTTTRSEQKANKLFFEWHPGGTDVVTRWCGQDATNAFAHAGPPHHKGVASEKGYGGLLVGALDTTTNRARATTVAAELPAGNADSLDWREDIGRQSWFHYHSVAAKYPDDPSPRDAEGIRGLAASLSLYPCEVCRHALLNGELDAVGPVPTDSRVAVSVWWCELHNLVNADLGKPRHACDLETLDGLYLRKCSACLAPPEESAPPAFVVG